MSPDNYLDTEKVQCMCLSRNIRDGVIVFRRVELFAELCDEYSVARRDRVF
jgi:hypothetical protein